MIEADIEGTWSEITVPIWGGIAESEVPFSDDGGGVSCALEDGGEGFGTRSDDGGAIGRGDAGPFLAKGVGTGEE